MSPPEVHLRQREDMSISCAAGHRRPPMKARGLGGRSREQILLPPIKITEIRQAARLAGSVFESTVCKHLLSVPGCRPPALGMETRPGLLRLCPGNGSAEPSLAWPWALERVAIPEETAWTGHPGPGHPQCVRGGGGLVCPPPPPGGEVLLLQGEK